MVPLSPGRRKIEAVAVFDSFEEELKGWLAPKQAPAWGAHRTQLDAIEQLMQRLVADLREDANQLDTLAVEELYDKARNLEVSVLWLMRLFDFLRAPFDQHDASRYRALLGAADEVAWSCYSIPFEVTNYARGPAPLPFVESRFSPAAYPREAVPGGLTEELGRFPGLNAMPMGLLRLPPSSLRAPWWLVLIGHEAGHHVQFDLLPNRELDTLFASGLVRAIENHPQMTKSDLYRWESWSQEIFADVFSLHCMGPWALRAMIELELRPPYRMDQPREFYPPPTVRLRLMAHAHDRMMETKDASDAVEPFAPETAAIQRLISAIPQVAEFALGQLPKIGRSLADICRFDRTAFRPREFVDNWRQRYWRPPYGLVPDFAEAPRLLAAAAMAAYASPEPGGDFTALADRIIEVIGLSRSEGDRAAQKVAGVSDDIFNNLRTSIRIASGLPAEVR